MDKSNLTDKNETKQKLERFKRNTVIAKMLLTTKIKKIKTNNCNNDNECSLAQFYALSKLYR